MKLSHWSTVSATAILSASLLAPAISWGAAAPAATADRAAASGSSASNTPAPSSTAISNDRIFYSLGVLLSQNLSAFNLSEHEFRQVLEGFTDGFRHHAKLEDARSLIPNLQAMQTSREKQAGAAFLAKASVARGARRTPSGLVYVSAVQGTGAAPKVTDRVTVQYTGKLLDGTVFDSSISRGQPATFPLGGIIPCWREALQLMKVGGKARVVCPPDLAYGDRGRPPVIPPGATLDFQIELLAVLPAPATVPPTPGVK